MSKDNLPKNFELQNRSTHRRDPCVEPATVASGEDIRILRLGKKPVLKVGSNLSSLLAID